MAYKFDDKHVEKNYPVIGSIINFLNKTEETVNVKKKILFALEKAERNGIVFGKRKLKPQIKHLQEQLLEHHFDQSVAEGQLRDLTDDFEKANTLIKDLIAKLEGELKSLVRTWGNSKDDMDFQLSLNETILELEAIGKHIAKESGPVGPNVFTDFGVHELDFGVHELETA